MSIFGVTPLKINQGSLQMSVIVVKKVQSDGQELPLHLDKLDLQTILLSHFR